MSRQRLSRYILKCPLPTLRFRLSISYVIRYIFHFKQWLNSAPKKEPLPFGFIRRCSTTPPLALKIVMRPFPPVPVEVLPPQKRILPFAAVRRLRNSILGLV
jgi:hypothetical protein